MIELIYYFCVQVMKIMAKVTGMGYIEINVLVFCIIEPIVFLAMLIIIVNQRQKLKCLNK